MIRVRENVNLLKLLKEKGFSAYELRRQKIFGESRMQRMREGKLPSWHELDQICRLTGRSLCDLIERVE